MNPVTGPTSVTTSSGASPRAWLKIRQKYKQARPYNLNLPYHAVHYRRIATGKGEPWNAGSYGGYLNSPLDFDTTGDVYYSYYKSYENSAITQAITKFNKSQGARASMGVAMAQHREATDMIGKRLKQVYDVFRSLKRFDLKGASSALGLSLWQARKRHRQWVRSGRRGPYSLRNEDIWTKDWTKVKARQRLRAVADLQLEFSFGWMPLVDDVVTSIGLLTKPVYFPTPIKSGGRVNFAYKATQTSDADSVWRYEYEGAHAVSMRVSVGGTLTVTNSNYKLASDLGLTSLAKIGYEVIPFSFVANYFINIEEFLQQFSQYDGVAVSQAWYSIVWDDTVRYVQSDYNKITKIRTVNTDSTRSAVSMKRVIGSLPMVKLGMRASYHNGIKRALNNASLLAQFLKR